MPGLAVMTQSSFCGAPRVLGLLIVLVAACAHAATPLLQWDANPEPGIVGYRVYSGSSSRDYTQMLDVGLQTSVPVTNLAAGVTRYFTVTAYNLNLVESPWSDEVWYTPPVDGVESGLVPLELTFSPAGATIRFDGRAGQRYHIAASVDLATWNEIYSATVMADGPVTFTDSSGNPMRFYRVIATPPVTSELLPFRLSVSGTSATIEFAGRAGQVCRIVASSDLRDWEQVHTTTLGETGPARFTEGITGNAMRFYRVMSLTP
jgi:hypothetical protein